MPSDARTSFERLYHVIQVLRSPDGCPWDREQTPRSLRGALVDEVWEAVSAIDTGDDENLAEELGDLYLLVTMICWMKEQEGSFTVAAALEGIGDKLIRRHPHVFGDARADSSAHVLRQWDAIKAKEKQRTAGTNAAAPASALERVPRSLPPLERSLELQKKAARVGFDWPGPEPVWGKIEEELAELKEALARGETASVEEETGDLLFSLVNLARLLKVNPTVALHGTNQKFERRFREVERRLAAEDTTPAAAGLARMDELWNQVKAAEKASK